MATSARRLYRNTTALRQLIQERMDDLDIRDTRAAERHSRGAISYSVLYSVLTGATRKIRRDTLERISKGLDLDLPELIDATHEAESSSSEPWDMPLRFAVLPASYRATVELVADNMLELYLRSHDGSSGSDDSKPGKTG